MRLQKYMSKCGVASRRHSEELIAQGLVQVNGQVVKTPGTIINPETDVVTTAGKAVKPPENAYILFNKPRGVVTTMDDPQGRKSVSDYFTEVPVRVYPVGRLDMNTEGLLLLTNDGELANMLMHPRYKVDKKYQALVKGFLSPRKVAALQKGVVLEDGKTAPAAVSVLEVDGQRSLVNVTLREGRKRQVRRMLEHVETPVINLRRTGYSFLALGKLKPGQFRYLTSGEVDRLKKEVGL